MAEIFIQHPDKASENSTRRIMRAVRQCSPITKLELQHRLGLSHPTVQAGVNRLLEAGIIRTGQTQGAARGRKPAALIYNYEARLALGVELRAEIIRLTLCDLKPTVLHRAELPGPGSEAALATPDFLRQLNSEINHFLVQHSIDPGRLLPTGLSLPGVYRDGRWQNGGTMLSQDDVQSFFTLPILCSTSRGMAGLAEIWDERIPDCSILTLDRELTLYAVRQGYPVTAGYLPLGGGQPELPGSPLAVSHLTLYPDGRPCACGRRGCAVCYCGADALLGGETAQAFFSAAADGEAAHLVRMDAFLDALSLLLCNVDMLFGSSILLTGELSEQLRPYMPQLQEKIRRRLSPGNTPAGTLTIGRYGRWLNAVAAAIFSIAVFFDGDAFAEF